MGIVTITLFLVYFMLNLKSQCFTSFIFRVGEREDM